MQVHLGRFHFAGDILHNLAANEGERCKGAVFWVLHHLTVRPAAHTVRLPTRRTAGVTRNNLKAVSGDIIIH